MPVQRLEIEARADLGDPLGEATRRKVSAWLGLDVEVRTRKVFHLDLGLDSDDADTVLDALTDPVAEVGALGMLPDVGAFRHSVWVGFLPGVTDVVGGSVKRAAQDALGRALDGRAYSSCLYLVRGVDETALMQVTALLHNPLIERATVAALPRHAPDLGVPRPGRASQPRVRKIEIREAGDAALLEISRSGMLALSLAEMQAIRDHFVGLGREPNDAELECLAQTWSEHCKHKIFASPIRYTDPAGQTRVIEGGLFRTYIRGATESVVAARNETDSFCVSVFHDNAGVVRFSDRDHLVYKVETHNTPSALDPYGGAMTGIVGVNRDSFGTGRGADLLTNVWGYCLGDPDYAGALPAGLMHPRRIREGVHEGVIDGGNHSGIPYSRGFEIFDDRYVGKPLVYCGTVAAMPVETAGTPTHEKYVRKGDKVVMVGGRIGKDGIHGATFSSVELDEDSPAQAVQIGDPITQKMMFDMLSEARDEGLMSGFTDNGAGGLSSSVGEMAELTGGARIDLSCAPLKYDGLEPWEILISEAQERMTVAVRPQHLDRFLALADAREVEATVLGEFTDSGKFEVVFGDATVCDLELSFLHEGVPLPTLQAAWEPPQPPRSRASTDLGSEAHPVRAVLAERSLRSHEELRRHYDHEVKGLSVVKPLLGVRGDVPATATVMRVRHGRPEGVVLGEGIHPHYGDLDTHAMALACVDEGVRRVLCAGARSDRIAALDNFCWPDPILSDKTPDGRHKLAQLVRCCEGLWEACTGFGVPLISGKDSMKNDSFLGGIKISIPPTLLVSVIGQMRDVTLALTLEPRASGDLVFVLGPTRLELGGSTWSRMSGVRDGAVPRTHVAEHWARYLAFEKARDLGLVRSAHAPGRGGLALALAHMVVSSELGLALDLAPLRTTATNASDSELVCSESTGRIVFTCRGEDVPALTELLAPHGLFEVGRVTAEPRLAIEGLAHCDLALLRAEVTRP